jgi:hypothetical protein
MNYVVRFAKGKMAVLRSLRKLHGKARDRSPGFAPIRSGKEVELV